jgi:nitrogen PTS system EIIA component
MNANFTFLPEAVGTSQAGSKAAILRELADRFADVYDLDRDLVAKVIQQRESLGSTGFGRGVAIPHARIPDLHRPVAVLLRLDAPVDFDAADGIPVDIVFGLLSPENSGTAHLHALACISRMMRDERMHEMLVEAPGAEALYGLLANATDRNAA